MNPRPKTTARELTPAQHRLIRSQLVMLPLYLWAIYIWQVFIQQLPFTWFGPTALVFRDFAHFYILGAVARIHDATLLFDEPAQKLLLMQHVPAYVDVAFPPSYGPQVAMLFRPLAALPYVPALIVWMAVTATLYLVTAWAVWRKCQNLRSRAWQVFALLTVSPALHFVLMYGQTSALALLCFGGAYLGLRHHRPFLAGLAIGGLFYKPQLGLASALLFVAAGHWRVVVGAIVGIAAQLLAAAAYWGVAVLPAYFEAVRRIPSTVMMIEPEKRHLHGWRAFFQMAGLEGSPLLAATIAASLCTLAVAITCWRRQGDLRLRFTVLMTTTVLINPHLYVYDLVILTPAGLLLWDFLSESQMSLAVTRGFGALLILGFAAPSLGFWAPQLHLQPSVLVLAIVTIAATALSFEAPVFLTSARHRALPQSTEFPL